MLSLSQMANRLSNEALFYACLMPFIVFFGVFAFVVYPNKEALHPTGKTTTAISSTGSMQMNA